MNKPYGRGKGRGRGEKWFCFHRIILVIVFVLLGKAFNLMVGKNIFYDILGFFFLR